MKIQVTKYHGLGNDFIILPYETFISLSDPTDFILRVCDRHTGIGADGLIAVKTDPFEMVYYNQDGTRAPMCGNGIRCFAAYCVDEKLPIPEPFAVQTLAGEKIITVTETDPYLFQVNMGSPLWKPEEIGLNAPVFGDAFLYQKKSYPLYTFFMSTVHTVTFVKDAFHGNETVGRLICHDSRFPEQTNVDFTEVVSPTHLRMQTYERGCGMTLACGTGACASAVIANYFGLVENKVDVELVKGHLEIEILKDGDNMQVLMTGPAKRILKGEFDYD